MDFPTFPKNWRKEKDKKDDIKPKINQQMTKKNNGKKFAT